MSKKSAVRGFGWKLAVAALAVAGVVGVAWAVLPTATTGKTGSMGVGYEVIQKKEIECVGKSPDKTALLATDFMTTPIANPGSLGYIKVTTNSNSWDIWMTTDNGGRLRYSEGAEPDSTCSAFGDPWNPTKCTGTWTYHDKAGTGTNEILTYGTTAGISASGILNTGSTGPDTVQLEVAIGVAYLGSQLNASAGQTTLYNVGAPGVSTPPYAVVFGDLEKTGTVVGSLASTTPTPIKFAQTLGTYYDGLSLSAPYDQLSGRDWVATGTGVTDMGFAAPNYTIVPNSPNTEEQYFFVNVGINQLLKNNIAGNTEGTYKETFKFELIASF